jgi:hypothetical protein
LSAGSHALKFSLVPQGLRLELHFPISFVCQVSVQDLLKEGTYTKLKGNTEITAQPHCSNEFGPLPHTIYKNYLKIHLRSTHIY